MQWIKQSSKKKTQKQTQPRKIKKEMKPVPSKQANPNSTPRKAKPAQPHIPPLPSLLQHSPPVATPPTFFHPSVRNKQVRKRREKKNTRAGQRRGNKPHWKERKKGKEDEVFTTQDRTANLDHPNPRLLLPPPPSQNKSNQ